MLNYVCFVRMLMATILTLVLQIVFCATYLSLNTEAEEEKKDKNIRVLNFVTLVISALFLIPALMLFGFHTYLIHKKVSTLEYLRRRRKKPKSKTVQKLEKSDLSDSSKL